MSRPTRWRVTCDGHGVFRAQIQGRLFWKTLGTYHEYGWDEEVFGSAAEARGFINEYLRNRRASERPTIIVDSGVA